MPRQRQLVSPSGDVLRQQQIASSLMERALAPRSQTNEPGAAFANSLGQIGEALIARKRTKVADEQMRRMQAEALAKMGNPDTGQFGPPAPENPYQTAQQALESGVSPGLVEAFVTQRFPEAGGSSASLSGYRQAKSEGYQGGYTDYLKEFEARAANKPADQILFELMQTLPQDKQKQLMEIIRGGQITEIGGVKNYVPPGVGSGLATPQPLGTLEDEEEARRRLAEQTALGTAQGANTGAIDAKMPALGSLQHVADRFYPVLSTTATGGPLGVRGRVGAVTDYQGAREFDNLREQLSTELRTIFRIPGEGTLSDREQAQYGLQLPDRLNDEELNKKILSDIISRADLRMKVGDQPEPYTPTTPIIPNSSRGQSGAAPAGVNWNDL